MLNLEDNNFKLKIHYTSDAQKTCLKVNLNMNERGFEQKYNYYVTERKW